MTVESTTRKQNYAGGQSALTFTFRALVDHPDDIKVVVVSSGTETLLTYDSQYTVTISTDGIGGVVIVSPSYSSAYTYTVYRETENKQESDYDDYNQFPANTLEEDIDRRTLVAQELNERIERSVALPISSTGSDLTLPEPVAGKALKWNATANGLVNTTVDIEDAITEAQNYASTASTQAGLAQASAVAAASSESNAGTSETNAANSATAAATSATTAIAAATSATASANAASTSATLAGLYASSASTQANNAVTSATLAGNYASTASTQATAAATSATLAGNYASTASTQASTASTQAALAGNYASTASTQAIAAATSATLAGNYATTAGTFLIMSGVPADVSIEGLKVTMTAAVAVSMGDLCMLNTAGTLNIAKADAIANASAVFMAGQNIAAGSSGTVLVQGIARRDVWNWTPGQLLYLTATGTAGNTISATAPTGTDQVIQVVAVATHADRIYFIPSLVQVEHT